MAISLAPLGTLRFRMIDSTRIAATPHGTRVIVTFGDLVFEGDQLKAKQRGPLAGDWLAVGPEGTASLDIRFVLETADGALIYVSALGRTDAAEFAKSGGPMYLTPVFETADPKYAWLNRVQAVAKGMATGSDVEFEVCVLA
jgi:hypothetical protein